MNQKDYRPAYFDDLVSFYADPSDQRTLKQFCIDNGYNEGTIFQFKRDHGQELWSAVDNVRQQYIPKLRFTAYKAVFANVNKSFNDRKLALQLTNDLVEKTESTTTILNPEEKRQKAMELLARLTHKEPEKAKDTL